MADTTTRELREQLTALRETVRAQGARLARHERRARRQRASERLLPLALAALLVALIPLATLAANPFTDLTGGVHDANIDAIYNAGITRGCEPDVAYCPTGLVTREEMASFLARAAGLGANPPVANARTAQIAQSATTLGGLPPGAFLRSSGTVTVWYMPWDVTALGGATITPQEGAVTVARGGAGSGLYTVVLPLDRPVTLADLPLRVVAAEVCVAQGSVEGAALRAATAQGLVTDVIADPTSRRATPGPSCFELRPPTPQVVDGALYLQLRFSAPATTTLYPVRLTLALP